MEIRDIYITVILFASRNFKYLGETIVCYENVRIARYYCYFLDFMIEIRETRKHISFLPRDL